MSELPADIRAAIDALEAWHEDTLRGYATENYDTVRAALDATILRHLSEDVGRRAADIRKDASERQRRLRAALTGPTSR